MLEVNRPRVGLGFDLRINEFSKTYVGITYLSLAQKLRKTLSGNPQAPKFDMIPVRAIAYHPSCLRSVKYPGEEDVTPKVEYVC